MLIQNKCQKLIQTPYIINDIIAGRLRLLCLKRRETEQCIRWEGVVLTLNVTDQWTGKYQGAGVGVTHILGLNQVSTVKLSS